MSTPENRPFNARVVDISPATAGDDNRVVVARIDAPSGRMELPVEEDHGLKPGDEVIITPIVQTHPSGGSVTIFQVKPSPF